MKMLLLIIAVCFVFVQSFSAQSKAKSENYKLTGTIKDKTGDVMSGLNLYVAKAGTNVGTFVTDINGDFRMDLQPGDYEITVNKTNSKDFRAFIKIQEGNVNPSNLVFVLDPDAACCSTPAGLPYPKTLSLPKPPYPAAARAVRASGEIIVAMIINKDGTVKSASVIGGHPLLRNAATAAARSSRFELSDENEEREAKLTYVFTLGETERSGLKQYSNPFRVPVVAPAAVVDY